MISLPGCVTRIKKARKGRLNGRKKSKVPDEKKGSSSFIAKLSFCSFCFHFCAAAAREQQNGGK